MARVRIVLGILYKVAAWKWPVFGFGLVSSLVIETIKNHFC